MNFFSFPRLSGILFSLLIFVGSFLFYFPLSYAAADNTFSQPYGLIVHNGNRYLPISRLKALEVLLRYFPEAESRLSSPIEMAFKDIKQSSSAFAYIHRACQLQLFDCVEEAFNSYQPVSQREFLKWFFKLKYADRPDFLETQYPNVRTDDVRVWLEARRLNLLIGNQITYDALQNLLYRNHISEENLDQPYSPGLIVDAREITSDRYHNLKEIDFIQNNLKESILNLLEKKSLNGEEKAYLRKVKENFNAFQELKNILSVRPYTLTQEPNLAPDVSQVVRQYGLQDILQTYSYDYSKNAAYRKHNLVTGVSKMHAKVFQPGEVIDYWSILSDKRLSDFQYGWVIAEGIEQWKFGGGICGSSSMVFLPSWKAGLEILERNSHSIYYSSLYPREYIGLDATVYRPRPNLKIRNNTDNPIVFNVINDTERQVITVEIIGNAPYKNVSIEGPIYVSRNHIKWVRHIEGFDGKMTSEALESRYSIIY